MNVLIINCNSIKVRDCYILQPVFDGIIKLEDFNLDNILIDEKTRENILIYDISYKNNWFKTFAN